MWEIRLCWKFIIIKPFIFMFFHRDVVSHCGCGCEACWQYLNIKSDWSCERNLFILNILLPPYINECKNKYFSLHRNLKVMMRDIVRNILEILKVFWWLVWVFVDGDICDDNATECPKQKLLLGLYGELFCVDREGKN